jgi:flavin reductase (DIM6/NTAB) family NADH-FMN oxidoreductase RutF
MDASTNTQPVERAGDVLRLLPPFPIALVTTRTNIITIGQLEYFTFSPLRIGIAIAHNRYTWSLVKAEREFVINVPGVDLVDAVNACGSCSGRDCDKFEAVGLTRKASDKVDAPGIGECSAWIECVVDREIEFEERTWFVGLVVAARSRSDHDGTQGLLCGRDFYAVPGEIVGSR